MVGKTVNHVRSHVKVTEFLHNKILFGVFKRLPIQPEERVLTLSCQREFIFRRLLTSEVEKANWAIHNPQVSINDKTAVGWNEIAQGRCLPQPRKMLVYTIPISL